MSSSEKRISKRIKRPFVAKVRLYQATSSTDSSATKWNIVTMKDLSATGVSFNYTQKIDPGTKLEFEITLPFSAEPIHCIGTVCRVNESKPGHATAQISVFWVAIAFTDMDESKKQAIIKYTESLK